MYYVVNNLYACAISFPLTFGLFERVDLYSAETFNTLDDEEFGYILEIDTQL